MVEREEKKGKRRRKTSAVQTVLEDLPVLATPTPNTPLGKPPLSQSFYTAQASLYVSVAPMYAMAPLQGIRVQHLDSLSMTYFPAVSGVVLACTDVQIDQDEGIRVMGESPFGFTWATADFLVWRPKRGDILDGRISIETRSHIGLLVFDVFNASIKRDRIPSKWRFVDAEQTADSEVATPELEEDEGEDCIDDMPLAIKSLGYWLDESGKKLDSKLVFVAESVEITGNVISIEASLLKLGDVNDLTAPGGSN
ncbi:uncharacterized protein V1518DRAFT_413527 [Limtongia smithiae]|uniref:uncharacterized protein n=1 Tax=Limtongia smithiae TaxID=1125753 RepID=UPI0034CD1E1E